MAGSCSKSASFNAFPVILALNVILHNSEPHSQRIPNFDITIECLKLAA